MKSHLILKNTSETEKYSGRGGGKLPLPTRDRNLHSQQLLKRISEIKEIASQHQHLLPFENGFYVEFESKQEYSLNLKSIETDGREMVSVRKVFTQIDGKEPLQI